MRVLAVDDESSILELLTEALPVLGCDDVKTAASAQEALEMLQSETPQIDCFLLDIQMPLMDGIVLCEKIRQMAQYKDTPIIMLTAMSEKSYVDQAFQNGATDYLTKPFDMAELSIRLQLAVKHRKVSEDSAPKSASTQNDIEKEPLETVERVISPAAFENYVLHMTRARLVTAGLFAIKIPEMHKPGKTLSAVEVGRWKILLANAVSQATQYDQSLISYVENGVFLILNKSWGTNKKDVLRQSILEIFDELDNAPRSPSRKRPTIVVGGVVSLPAFGRSFTLAYLRKAIRKAEELCQPATTRPAMSSKLTRKRNKDTQTGEYKKLLTQVIDEFDPLATGTNQKQIVPRRVSASLERRQFRTAV